MEISCEDEEVEEECTDRHIAPSPTLPSQSEIEDHRVDHLPYRSWCKPCIMGRAVGDHHKVQDEESTKPVIAFDYLIVSKKGQGEIVIRRDEAKEGEEVLAKILVVKDTKSKSIFAHVVPQKGVDSDRYSVSRLTEDILWLGYTEVILKSDNEKAIVKLLRESLKVLRVKSEITQAQEEHGAAYDSQSHGSVENAVRQVQGLIRTMRQCLEERIGHRIPCEARIILLACGACGHLADHTSEGERRQNGVPEGEGPGVQEAHGLLCRGGHVQAAG